MAVIQRFGGALNLNVHLHVLVIDGVFAPSGDGLTFWPAPSLARLDVAEVLAGVVARVGRLLAHRGMGDADEAAAAGGWAEQAPVLAGIAAASVQGRVALGPRAGGRVRRYGDPVEGADGTDAPALGRCHARQDGFDLHAEVRVPAGARDRLDRLSRYALRPPVAQDRLQLTADGQVQLRLAHRWVDGTTHLRFDPLELLERLAVLTLRPAQGHPEQRRGMIPRPRINLILYHGVLAPRAALRSRVVRYGKTGAVRETRADVPEADAGEPVPAERGPARSRGRALWADLMRRSFGIEVLLCPRCGPSTRLKAVPSIVEGRRSLPSDRPDRRASSRRAHPAASGPSHRDSCGAPRPRASTPCGGRRQRRPFDPPGASARCRRRRCRGSRRARQPVNGAARRERPEVCPAVYAGAPRSSGRVVVRCLGPRLAAIGRLSTVADSR